MPKKRKPAARPGRTTTFSVSVDAETKAGLKAAAARWHGGNMSRLVTAVARRLADDAAFERAWEWYGGPAPTRAEIDAIDAWIDRIDGKPARRGSASTAGVPGRGRADTIVSGPLRGPLRP